MTTSNPSDVPLTARVSVADVARTLGLVPNPPFADRAGAVEAYTGFTIDVDSAEMSALAAGFVRVYDYGEGSYWAYWAKPLGDQSLVFEYIEGDLRLYAFSTVDGAVAFCEHSPSHC